MLNPAGMPSSHHMEARASNDGRAGTRDRRPDFFSGLGSQGYLATMAATPPTAQAIQDSVSSRVA